MDMDKQQSRKEYLRKWQQKRRRNETCEEKENRLQKQRQRYAQQRRNETQQQKENRKQKDAKRKRQKRKEETFEQTQKRKAKDNERKKQKKRSETEEQKTNRRKRFASYQSQRRNDKKKRENIVEIAKQSQSNAHKNEPKGTSETTSCMICGTAEINAFLSPCGHRRFCVECIQTWLNIASNCPICRQEVNVLTNCNNRKRTMIPPKRQRYEESDGSSIFLQSEAEHCFVCGEEESIENMTECHFCECVMHFECEVRHNCESESEDTHSDSVFEVDYSAEPAGKRRKLN